MTSTNEQGLNGEFEATDVEPVIEQLLAVLKGVPANLAGMAVISTMLELSRLEAEVAGEKDYGGFEMNCRVKDFRVTIRAVRNDGGLAVLLQELMQGEGPDMENPMVSALMQAVARTKDGPTSEGYCECEACTERRAIMNELRSAKPSAH